jgi:hypothetical protein
MAGQGPWDGESVSGLFPNDFVPNVFAAAPSSPIGERPARAVEVTAANAALSRLDELQSASKPESGHTWELPSRMLFDTVLVEQKEGLKAYPPVRVRCPAGHHLDWIALAPLTDHGLQLVHGTNLQPHRFRQGGASDIRSGTGGGRAALGTVTWVEDAKAGIGNVQPEPDGDHGETWGSKADYHCARCDRSWPVLHTTLLRLWLDAVKRGDRETSLAGLDLGRPTYAERIEDRGSARAWSTHGARPRR